MAIKYADNSDYVYRYAVESWSTIRNNSTGTVVSDTANQTGSAVRILAVSGRGAIVHRVERSYFYFDTSGITSTVASATLKIFGYNSGTAEVIAVKSDAFGGDGGTALATADFNNFDTSTPYSGGILSWDTTDYNDITLNATALDKIKTGNAFIVCVMDLGYDYANSAPSAGTDISSGMYYDAYTGTSRDPYIDYTLATGYGHTVNGVASASISKVKGVATANIEKVIGT